MWLLITGSISVCKHACRSGAMRLAPGADVMARSQGPRRPASVQQEAEPVTFAMELGK